MRYRYRLLIGLWVFTVSAVGLAQGATPKELYLAKCSKCHRLYDPKEYDDASWEKWMGKMKKKARLKDEQYEQISSYLESVRSQ